jgi:PAS domain S-box-containing protein
LSPSAPRAASLETTITRLFAVAILPTCALALYFLWHSNWPSEARWTVSTVLVLVWLMATLSARRAVTHLLQLVADLLGALRSGDYSARGLLPRQRGKSLGLLMGEVNELASTLQRQRAEVVESAALLSHVMEELTVGVFAFDSTGRLLFVNKAGERLLDRRRDQLIGVTAAAIDFAEYLQDEPRRLVQRTFAGRLGRYEMRRAVFYRDGWRHQLVVLSDVSQALREEEQAAWQRIVRVLSHEINNSLTPIKSIAHSLQRRLARDQEDAQSEELNRGLALIEERSGALSRFLRAYAQLAKLPKPRLEPVQVSEIISQVIALEHRHVVVIRSSPPVELLADSDQFEQLLINLIRNAVDAVLAVSGEVAVSWGVRDHWFELSIEDDGPGLADTSNLFVPFFTTKPNGSGIGLALSRQIAEAHGGLVTLENRRPHGCRAVVRLPLQPSSNRRAG